MPKLALWTTVTS